MHEIRTCIEIESTSEEIWAILVDFEAHPKRILRKAENCHSHCIRVMAFRWEAKKDKNGNIKTAWLKLVGDVSGLWAYRVKCK